jgi:hypothetical protein
MSLSGSISTELIVSASYARAKRKSVQPVKVASLERWRQEAAVLEAENDRLRAALGLVIGDVDWPAWEHHPGPADTWITVNLAKLKEARASLEQEPQP